MAELDPCLPYGMLRALRAMEREGWRIISARGDTGLVLASYYGTAVCYWYNASTQELEPHSTAVEAVEKTEGSS